LECGGLTPLSIGHGVTGAVVPAIDRIFVGLAQRRVPILPRPALIESGVKPTHSKGTHAGDTMQQTVYRSQHILVT